MTMNHACVLLHGIDCESKDRIWSEEVEAGYQSITSIPLITRKYGYISGLSVWFSSFQRQKAVDHEEAYFRGLQDDLGPNGRISVASHSLGGYIITALLKRGIKFHRIAHLWGSTISDFNWHAVATNFDEVRVYWSPTDEILTASPVAAGEDPELALGLMGKEGASAPHPRVKTIRDPYGFTSHTAFMDYTIERDKFWRDIFKWMEGDANENHT